MRPSTGAEGMRGACRVSGAFKEHVGEGENVGQQGMNEICGAREDERIMWDKKG